VACTSVFVSVMTRMQNLVLLLALLSLVACEPASHSPEPPKKQPAQEQPHKPTAEAAADQVKPAPVESRAAPQSSTQTEPPAVQVEPKASAVEHEPAAEKPLDLSWHADLFDPLQALEPEPDPSTSLLPPLFGEKTETESRYQLNGKLLTNDSDDVLHSVDGAQLQLEFKP